MSKVFPDIFESVVMFSEGMTPTEELAVWEHNAKLLKHVKDVEMQQRKQCVAKLFGTHDDGLVGTQKYDLGHGWTAKTNFSYETKLDPGAFNAIRADLPVHIVDAAIKFDPKLVAKGYKDLCLDDREKLDECLITKPKTVTLEIVPPKPPKD